MFIAFDCIDCLTNSCKLNLLPEDTDACSNPLYKKEVKNAPKLCWSRRTILQLNNHKAISGTFSFKYQNKDLVGNAKAYTCIILKIL